MLASPTAFVRNVTALRPMQPLVSSRAARLVVRAEKPAASKSLEIPSAWKPVVLTAVSNVVLAAPALAGGGKIFDFNLTLPIMAGQFLLLMLFLDKFWFGPVGRVLDERDSLIRDKLASVGDNSAEIARLEEEAAKTLKEARAEAQAAINQARAEAQAEMTEKFEAAKMEVDKELEAAFTDLESEQARAMETLDSQVDAMTADILSRVLPEGVRV